MKKVKDGPRLPSAPRSIEAGKSLAGLLGEEAVDCLAHNLSWALPKFDGKRFRAAAVKGLDGLGLMDRGRYLAGLMHEFLPKPYEAAIEVMLKSMTPPLPMDGESGMEVFFYLPHSFFIAAYGLDPTHNGGKDPFEVSMRAQYELTRRFTAEFCIRPFLVQRKKETLQRLMEWTRDPDLQVRRLCSEGSRPRLPWGLRLQDFVKDPRPTLPILEALKDDPELYVRRSVANHLGDIGKDHPELLFKICRRWVRGASPERKWLIRHAVRYPAKHGVAEAIEIRQLAKR